jgi:demethylmenaquinone methyltransferase/2-methoxy-6-polyprenyl-1,4-benzoquinol methylase
MSEKVRSMFDAISGRYDLLNHSLSAGRDTVWRRKAVNLFQVSKSNALVLDLCGGTGDFSLAWNRKHANDTCIVGDFSQSMLQMGARKGMSHLSVMDALSLPFKDGMFDVVLCGFGMRNLDDLEAGIRAVHSVLKPGGTFLTLEFFRPETGFTIFFYRGLAPLFIPILGAALGSKKSAYEYLVKSVQGFCGVDKYADLCRSAGFGDVQTRAYDFGIAHAVVAMKPVGKA